MRFQSSPTHSKSGSVTKDDCNVTDLRFPHQSILQVSPNSVTMIDDDDNDNDKNSYNGDNSINNAEVSINDNIVNLTDTCSFVDHTVFIETVSNIESESKVGNEVGSNHTSFVEVNDLSLIEVAASIPTNDFLDASGPKLFVQSQEDSIGTSFTDSETQQQQRQPTESNEEQQDPHDGVSTNDNIFMTTINNFVVVSREYISFERIGERVTCSLFNRLIFDF